MKKGVLLLNLGTPDNPHTPAVCRYLKAFLMDPRVIDIPWVLRFALVYGLIIPFRAPKSAKAYQSILTETGSPLLTNSLALKAALSETLGADFVVALGMRYGKPSIQSALEALQNQKIDHLTIIPLFPQYASSATGSALETCLKTIASQNTIPNIRVIRDFYNMPGYIDTYADLIQQNMPNKSFKSIDRILFSYHGLPERHSDSHDYQKQCYETTRLIAQKLGLRAEQYQVCFQSRLGRTPWIKPYTDQLLIDLSKQGVRTIAIVCPSFVGDCLETLEEINIRAREQWQSLRGKTFVFVPCVNTHPMWVEGLVQKIRSF